MMSIRRMLLVATLIVAGGGGCATSHASALAPPHRIPDSAPERLAGLQEADPEVKAGATEERFSTQADRKRRAEARAKEKRQGRVDVVEPARKALDR
jgi:hypothetical protein